MLLDNQTDRKEMEIEEPIDIALKHVSTTGDVHSKDDSLEAVSTLSL